LRQVALARVSSDSSSSSLRLTRGFRGVARVGLPPHDRRGSLVSELCPGTASLQLPVASRRSRFAWSGRHSRDVFPSVRVASSGRAGAGPVEFRLVGLRLNRPGLGIPRTFTVTPPGEHERLGRIRGSRPRVLRLRSTFRGRPHLACAKRLASVSSASSSFRPGAWIAPRSRPCEFAWMVAHPRSPSGPSVDVCFEIAKDRPFTVSGVESPRPASVSPPSLRSRDAARLARRLRGFAPPGQLSPARPCPGIAPDFPSWGS